MKQGYRQTDGGGFLPDLCSLPSVLAVVVLAQLFALILTLALVPHSPDPWHDLAMITLFMQWVGLSCAALLCATRPWLARLPDMAAGLLGYLMLLLIILLLSEVAWWLSEQGGLPLIETGRREFLLRNLGIGAIISALALRYFYMRSQWQRGIQAESEARLQALQARIRPHFLFNSINTVSSLIHSHPGQAEEALLDLADLFRASLREEQRLIPLREEIVLARQYLYVESLRLGPRLQQHWQVEADCEGVLIPPLILQPLVENAVYHGIEPYPPGGTVQVAITCEGGRLAIRVSNPLPDKPPSRQGRQLAVANITQRLHAHYGARARLSARQQDGLYEVTIEIHLE